MVLARNNWLAGKAKVKGAKGRASSCRRSGNGRPCARHYYSSAPSLVPVPLSSLGLSLSLHLTFPHIHLHLHSHTSHILSPYFYPSINPSLTTTTTTTTSHPSPITSNLYTRHLPPFTRIPHTSFPQTNYLQNRWFAGSPRPHPLPTEGAG